MLIQERVRPAARSLRQQRVLPLRGRHLDLGLTSMAIKPLTQGGEVLNHAGTILVLLVMPLRHDQQIISAHFKRCFIGARIKRRERKVLS